MKDDGASFSRLVSQILHDEMVERMKQGLPPEGGPKMAELWALLMAPPTPWWRRILLRLGL